MKKSAKPLIAALLISLLLITAVILVAISVRFNYEKLVRDKDLLEKKLKTSLSTKNNIIAEYQMASAEEIVVSFALNELRMVRSDETVKTIKINSSKLTELKDHLNKKYD